MFSERLQQARIEAGLKQRDIAKKVDLTTSAYGYYEQGKREPNLETLHKLCSILDVSSDYLLGFNDKDEFTKSYSLLHSSKSRDALSPNEIELLDFYNKGGIKYGSITKYFPNASILSSDEKELLSYYAKLSLLDKRWIMGQIIDLIKREENVSSKRVAGK